MKKVIIAVAALLIGISANAQVWINAGFLGGYEKVTSSILEFPVTDFEHAYGFFVGTEYEIPLSRVFSVAPGLQFQAGFATEPDYRFAETQIAIPILVRAAVPFGTNARGFLNVGPDFAIGLSSKEVDHGVTYDSYKEDFSRFNLGVIVGLGVDIRERLRIFATYNFGVINTCKMYKTTAYDNKYQIGIGFAF